MRLRKAATADPDLGHGGTERTEEGGAHPHQRPERSPSYVLRCLSAFGPRVVARPPLRISATTVARLAGAAATEA
jgi:hypothetical protein